MSLFYLSFCARFNILYTHKTHTHTHTVFFLLWWGERRTCVAQQMWFRLQLTYTCERSAKPQWKKVKVIVFGLFASSLYRFAIRTFLSQRSICMLWYEICQCNSKSQLHRPFSSSETSFELSLLEAGEEVWLSSHSDMLQAFRWQWNHWHGHI